MLSTFLRDALSREVINNYELVKGSIRVYGLFRV